MVVVDTGLREQLKGQKRVSFRDLVMGTVRLWPYKANSLNLPLLRPGLHDWNMSYDPTFLGYVQGVIERGRIESEGGFIL